MVCSASVVCQIEFHDARGIHLAVGQSVDGAETGREAGCDAIDGSDYQFASFWV